MYQFDNKKYYNQSKLLENVSIVLLILYCTITIGLGIKYLKMIGILIGFFVGIITGYIPYLKAQIKAQEMRMNLEIYNILNKKESK